MILLKKSIERKINVMEQKSRAKSGTLRICLTAVFMALNVAVSSFGIPMPGSGHLYLCDVVICIAAIILDPVSAFLVGGVGSFLGDLFFYPAAMVVSLFTHGLQAVAVSLFSRYTFRSKPWLGSLIGVSVGAIIMAIGYFLGAAFVYSTIESAIANIPYELAQSTFGAVCSMLICYKCGVLKLAERMGMYKRPNEKKKEEESSQSNA